MSTAGNPLAEALGQWRAARSAVHLTSRGSPDWEEATLLADEAGWQYLAVVADRKEELVAASRGVLESIEEIDRLNRELASAASADERSAIVATLRTAMRTLLIHADEEDRLGEGIPLSADSIAEVEADITS
jgi:hypothetical protein